MSSGKAQAPGESAEAGSKDAPQPAAAKPAEDAPLPEKTRMLAKRLLIFSIFQSVLQHVLPLQSQVTVFSQAAGGDQAKTMRALAASTGVSGIVGLFLNQIGGKLSDSIGRKALFMSGPALNIVSAMTVLRSKNMAALMASKVIKDVFTTFSGTVMCQASLADVLSGTEMAVVGTYIQVGVGIAVTMGPYIESLLLKMSKGNPRIVFKAMIAVSMFQIINNGLLLPETLIKSKRVSIDNFLKSVASLNPLAFMKIYASKHTALKKLLTIQTLQMCCDGKVTSDLFQMWSRNQLQWTANTMRDFVAFWGLAVASGSAVLHPYLLRTLSVFEYSTVGNLFVCAGLMIHGLAKKGWCMWGGIPFLIPGVNGGNAHAIKSLSLDMASQAGYGNGEFSGWANNIRAMVQSLHIVFLGRWYAMCTDKGLYTGSTWWIAGLVGGALPQILLMSMKKDELRLPEKGD